MNNGFCTLVSLASLPARLYNRALSAEEIAASYQAFKK